MKIRLPGTGAKDPRDMTGQNPTERERKSSARKRGQAARGMERDPRGTEWENGEEG